MPTEPLHTLPHRQAVNVFRRGMLEAIRTGGPEVHALLEDRARSDQNVRRTYAGRYVLELLQNACDAHDRQVALHAEARAPAPEPARAAVLLTDTHLMVANTGWPFSFESLAADEPSGIASACRYGASSKTEQRFKGQFGIGLKSVDEVADEVLIASTGYRLRFCRERLREALGASAPAALPLFYAPEWFEPEDAPPGFSELTARYTTVLALRLRQGVSPADIRERLAEVGPVEVLLLETLRELRIEDLTGGERRIQTFHLDQTEMAPERWRIRMLDGQHESEEHRFLVFRKRIGSGVQEHRLVWPIDSDGGLVPLPPAKRVFYTFYPVTRERSRAPFVVHSYFRLDPSRKSFAAETTDREINRSLVDGLADLLAEALPAVTAHPRGGAPLHRLLWLEPDDGDTSDLGTRFANAARDRLWGLPAIEGRDGVARPGTEYAWPLVGSGLDEALAKVALAPAPFPRDADVVSPRPARATALTVTALGLWLVDHPPVLPAPTAFLPLIDALGRLVPTDQRSVFRAAAKGARLLPIAEGEGFRQVGQDERTQVFLPSTRAIPIPAELRQVLDVYLLHEDARADDRGAVLRDLFDLVPLRPEDLVERLARAVEARPVDDVGVAVSILDFLLHLFRSEVAPLAETSRVPAPWFADELWHDPGAAWRTRMRLSALPLALADGGPIAAGALVIEDTPGEIAGLYPGDTPQRFLNRDTENPTLRATLDRLLRELVPNAPADGWPFRRAVYAWLGAWPMPRLHAVYHEGRDRSSTTSPHAGVTTSEWMHYLSETGGSARWGASVYRSLAWPDFREIVEHCRAKGLLGRLLDVVQRNASVLVGRSEPVLRVGSSGQREYREPMVRWQLRTTAWLPVVGQGGSAGAGRPDRTWWTSHRLDPARLSGARWNHLPFIHAGLCDRYLAERLGLAVYEVASSPSREESIRRTRDALVQLAATSDLDSIDGAGLRRLYRELTTRLAELRPSRDEVKEITLVLTTAADRSLVATRPQDAILDDLPLPLPLGRERLPLAVFGAGCGELADRLGIRRLSHCRVRYHADDLDEHAPDEPLLTGWLQDLCPYAFALRAFGAMVPESQRIDVTVEDTRRLVARYRLAVVEVVGAVQLIVDDKVIDTQAAENLVVLAHDLDARGVLPVFMRRDFVARHDTTRLPLFHVLAGTAAQLAGDTSLAHSLELLAREAGPGDPLRAERFLRERCGVSREALAMVRRTCGETVHDEDGVRQEATRKREGEEWRARAAALCRPLLALLLSIDHPLRVDEVRTRLESFRGVEGGALAAARAWFTRLGVDAQHAVWEVACLADAEQFLREHGDLAERLRLFLAVDDDAAARSRAGEAAVARVRILLLTYVRARQPEARLDDLLAMWEDATDALDRAAPDVEAKAARGFLALTGLEPVEIERVCTPPDDRWGAPAHLAVLEITAQQLVDVHGELERHDALEAEALARSERAYRAWIRQKGLHLQVERRTLVPPVPPAPGQPAPPPQTGPVQRLTLEVRDGASGHRRQHRRNTVTGGLGEVFFVLQEIESWRKLAPEERASLIRQVSAEYGGDAAAATLAARVEATPVGTEEWEEALLKLLRIGDYVGARCDVLGVRRDADGVVALVYVEVKSTRRDRLDAFEISDPEWAFLNNPNVRDRSVIACVSRAARGLTPAVALLINPARLAEQGRLTVRSSAHHVEIARA